MSTWSRSRVTGAVGAITVIAGVALIAAMIIPADPLGRLVGACIGGSFVVGLIGALVREGLERRELRRARPRPLPAEGDATAATVVALPHVADATASELKGARRPAFAPVISLTEEQVVRARAARKRQERRETLTGA